MAPSRGGWRYEEPRSSCGGRGFFACGARILGRRTAGPWGRELLTRALSPPCDRARKDPRNSLPLSQPVNLEVALVNSPGALLLTFGTSGTPRSTAPDRRRPTPEQIRSGASASDALSAYGELPSLTEGGMIG
jgi:hypothetical protein